MGASNLTTGTLWNTLLNSDRGPIETTGALSVAEGRCQGRLVRVMLTDRSISGGSFGVEECNALSRHLARSIEDAIPVALVLDSGGARLDSGLAGLAAFRRMFQTALDVRLSGVSMSALILRNCFGGASMLAMLCSKRGALKSARIGMSGPAIIENLSGKSDLDSSDAAAVSALFGASAREEAGAIDYVFDDHVSVGDALFRLAETAQQVPPDLREQHVRLANRLRSAGVALPNEAEIDAGDAFRNGFPVGARDIWLLADKAISLPTGQAMQLIIDCPGQAATRNDESLVLSEYVTHLAMCLRARSVDESDIAIHIRGESAGGIYVALAAGANTVSADSQATVRVLPSTAVQTVLRRTLPDETIDDARNEGAVDHIVYRDNSAREYQKG